MTAAITIDGDRLNVWLAQTNDERTRGLMHVENLPEGIDGMLFVFESFSPRSFWMLNTLMPLDIWWFDDNNTLTGVTRMEPCESEPCPSYPSPGSIMWALETPADEFDFEPGALLHPPGREAGAQRLFLSTR